MLRAKLNILGAVEIELLLLLVFHGKVISSNLYLVKLVWIDEHLSFGLSEKILDILSLVLKILIFGCE